MIKNKDIVYKVYKGNQLCLVTPIKENAFTFFYRMIKEEIDIESTESEYRIAVIK